MPIFSPKSVLLGDSSRASTSTSLQRALSYDIAVTPMLVASRRTTLQRHKAGRCSRFPVRAAADGAERDARPASPRPRRCVPLTRPTLDLHTSADAWSVPRTRSSICGAQVPRVSHRPAVRDGRRQAHKPHVIRYTTARARETQPWRLGAVIMSGKHRKRSAVRRQHHTAGS